MAGGVPNLLSNHIGFAEIGYPEPMVCAFRLSVLSVGVLLTVYWLSLAGCVATSGAFSTDQLSDPGLTADERPVLMNRLEQAEKLSFEAMAGVVLSAMADNRHDLASRKQLWTFADGLDPGSMAHLAGRSLLMTGDRQTVAWLAETIAERGWADQASALVRSLARPDRAVEIDRRPEWSALAKLFPDRPVESTLADFFLEAPEGNDRLAVALSAWHILVKRFSRDRQASLIREAAERGHVLGTTMLRSMSDWEVIPDSREELYRLVILGEGRLLPVRPGTTRSADGQDRELSRRIGVMREAGAAQPRVRHLPAISWGTSEQIGRSRAERQRMLQRHLATVDRHEREPSTDLKLLCDYDLLTLELLIESMGRPDLVASWFEQADADLADIRTEYGGLLKVAEHEDNGSRDIRAVAYMPITMRHDYAYYSPPGLLIDLPHAIAHYHFHAQDYRNRHAAHPGPGDLEFADQMRITGLVLTFINRRTLNVDFYAPGGIVVDLGNIHRP